MTENISPSPYPLPSRARECRKNLPLKGEGYWKNVLSVFLLKQKNLFKTEEVIILSRLSEMNSHSAEFGTNIMSF
jgi:hypothetical protein